MPTRLLRRRLLLASPLLPWNWPARAAETSLSLDQIMARLAAAAVADRRATFSETRRFAAVNGPLESTGHLVLRHGHLEKTTDWPRYEKLEIDGNRVVVTAANDPPRVIELSNAPELRPLIDAIRAPLLGDAAALTRAFDATTSGTMAAWTIDLVPRDPAGKKLLRSVELHGHEDQLDRLAITQADGDEQVMVIRPA